METAIGYAGVVGVSCMDKVASLNEKFRELPEKVEMMDVAMTDFNGWLLLLEEREVSYEEESVRRSKEVEAKLAKAEEHMKSLQGRVCVLRKHQVINLRQINTFCNTITGWRVDSWSWSHGGSMEHSDWQVISGGLLVCPHWFRLRDLRRNGSHLLRWDYFGRGVEADLGG
jgi:hypothetical protein